MEIIAVKAQSDCFKKAVIGLSAGAEALMCKMLRIKWEPFSCGYSEIQDGRQLKAAMTKLDGESEIQACNSVKAVRQYINVLDDAVLVVMLGTNTATSTYIVGKEP